MYESMCTLTPSSLSNIWSQLREHLCLFLTPAAAERSAPALALTCSALLTPGGSPLSASPKLTRQDVPSPIRPLPSPRSALSCRESFKPTSFLVAEKKQSSSKTRTASSNPSLPSLTPKGQIPVRADRAEVKQHLSDTLLSSCVLAWARGQRWN